MKNRVFQRLIYPGLDKAKINTCQPNLFFPFILGPRLFYDVENRYTKRHVCALIPVGSGAKILFIPSEEVDLKSLYKLKVYSTVAHLVNIPSIQFHVTFAVELEIPHH